MKQAGFSLGLLAIVGCSAPGAPSEPSIGTEQSALNAEQCAYFESGGKIQICHATTSPNHPYKILKVSSDACLDSHALHPDDYVAVDDPTCNGGGCLPELAPCDATLPCCDGLECRNGTCQAPVPVSSDGCPAGSFSRSVSSDGQSFTMIFDKFVASTGPGVPESEATKRCVLTVDIDTPAGTTWTFDADYRGYVQVASDQSGQHRAVYAPGAYSPQESNFFGPAAKDYLRRDTVLEADIQGTACAGGLTTVTIDTSVSVTPSASASGQITTDSIDYKLRLVPCP